MKAFLKTTAALVLAATLPVQATATQAGTSATCLSEREASDLVVYMVPAALSAVQSKCSKVLRRDGFMATRSDRMAQSYSAANATGWRSTKGAILKLLKSGTGKEKVAQELDILRVMPDDVVRPFVDALLAQKIAEEIKVDNCARIEKLAEATAPLEPKELGNLLVALAGMAESKALPLCRAEEL